MERVMSGWGGSGGGDEWRGGSGANKGREAVE